MNDFSLRPRGRFYDYVIHLWIWLIYRKYLAEQYGLPPLTLIVQCKAFAPSLSFRGDTLAEHHVVDTWIHGKTTPESFRRLYCNESVPGDVTYGNRTRNLYPEYTSPSRTFSETHSRASSLSWKIETASTKFQMLLSQLGRIGRRISTQLEEPRQCPWVIWRCRGTRTPATTQEKHHHELSKDMIAAIGKHQEIQRTASLAVTLIPGLATNTLAFPNTKMAMMIMGT